MENTLTLLLQSAVQTTRSQKNFSRQILQDEDLFKEVVSFLDHSRKDVRSAAAEKISDLCRTDPSASVGCFSNLLRAVKKYDEPQTVGSSTLAMSYLASVNPDLIGTAWSTIEDLLHHPTSLFVRKAAIGYFGELGKAKKKWGEKVIIRLRSYAAYCENREYDEVLRVVTLIGLNRESSARSALRFLQNQNPEADSKFARRIEHAKNKISEKWRL